MEGRKHRGIGAGGGVDYSDMQALDLAKSCVIMLCNYLRTHLDGTNHSPWSDREITNSRNELRDCIAKAASQEVKDLIGSVLDASFGIRNDQRSLQEALDRLHAIFPEIVEMRKKYERGTAVTARVARELVRLAKSLVAEGSGSVAAELVKRFSRRYVEIKRKAHDTTLYARSFTFNMKDGDKIMIFADSMLDAVKQFCKQNPLALSDDVDSVEFVISTYMHPVTLK